MENRKRKIIELTFLLILCVSVGYASLSTSLNLGGSTNIAGNIWDVHFEHVTISDKSVKTTIEDKATISEDRKTVNFDVSLDKPGDFYEFTVFAVNSGTIDAMIDNIDKIEFTEDQAKVLEYSITTSSGEEIKRLDGLYADSKSKLKVVLKYKEDVDAEAIKNVDINNLEVSFSIDFIQATPDANFLIPFKAPTMLNVGFENSDANISSLKAYYPNLETVTLSDSINVPDGVLSWDISEAGNESVMAYVVPSKSNPSKYDLHIEGDGGISSPKRSNGLFWLARSSSEKCTYKNIIGLEVLDTSDTINMNDMFHYTLLETVNLSTFDTSNARYIGGMFSDCSNLVKVDLSGFDTRNVERASYMFKNCTNLTSLDLSNFDTPKLRYLDNMFDGCSNLTNLDLSNATFIKILGYTNTFNNTPNGMTIIVKDEDSKNFIESINNTAIVKIVE